MKLLNYIKTHAIPTKIGLLLKSLAYLGTYLSCVICTCYSDRYLLQNIFKIVSLICFQLKRKMKCSEVYKN